MSLRRVEETLAPGDLVEAYDPDAELECLASVTEVDREAGRAYLRPHWEQDESAQTIVPTAGFGRVFVWDGYRVAPVSPQATNLAGGTTLARSPHVTPLVTRTNPLAAAV